MHNINKDQESIKIWRRGPVFGCKANPIDHLFDVWDTSAQRDTVEAGLSLGAYDNGVLISIAIAEAHMWNRTLQIWESGVAATQQQQGIGRQMMDALAAGAQSHGLRVMVAETQNTNGPAIRFYRKVGFEFDAIDLSLYTNRDVEEGEVALYMKRKLDE